MTIRDSDGFELVEHDPYTGRSVWSYFDGEKTVYRIDQPVDDVIRSNAEERAHAGTKWRGDWHKIGSIPMNVYRASGMHDAIGQKDDRFIARWLTENDAWRTKDGSL